MVINLKVELTYLKSPPFKATIESDSYEELARLIEVIIRTFVVVEKER